jgi:hypothetical protein
MTLNAALAGVIIEIILVDLLPLFLTGRAKLTMIRRLIV